MNHSNQPWNMTQDNVMLGGNEVHVWKASLEAPLSTIYSLQHLLSEEEVKRARQFYFEKDRLHWIVTHGILRMLLGHYLDSDPRRLSFVTNGYGKPYIAYPSDGIRLRFNLTHSGDIALYAFTYDRHVGVDVEYMRAGIDFEKLAQNHFSPYECAVLRALPPALREEAFFLCWTRKEAYIKARGRGLSIPLDQFDVSLTPGEPAELLDSREDPHGTANWSLHTLTPGERYAGALVVEGTDWHLSCWQWSG
jgi:4'-phosphopantetheinyl transferase